MRRLLLNIPITENQIRYITECSLKVYWILIYISNMYACWLKIRYASIECTRVPRKRHKTFYSVVWGCFISKNGASFWISLNIITTLIHGSVAKPPARSDLVMFGIYLYSIGSYIECEWIELRSTFVCLYIVLVEDTRLSLGWSKSIGQYFFADLKSLSY